jgi:hypothetical protein
VKENLKPCVYKQSESVYARRRTFCRTVRRVMIAGKVKYWRYVAAGKPSLNRANESVVIDPKPGDLSMSRLK